jgi:hypothetical protein
MSDSSQGDPPGETPMQKALRLKQAAMAARTSPPRGKFQGERAAAAVSSSKSKPWMKK